MLRLHEQLQDFKLLLLINNIIILSVLLAQSAGAVEYTDSFSAEG